ncbi:putative oxidoreductase [Lasiodiplodia theobromae]|uniref:Putative oxidoreductase n=1 Tax=Lasiodiplodia theobromae TaxID=45133 RepID=A0A5N5D911_9PEZI|nr:putative oxidoreductase [Lasiodiplodia theobromae]
MSVRSLGRSAARSCRQPRRFIPCIASRPISQKTYTLNTGAQLPAIGFGTFQDKEQQESAVYNAINAGFRHIDTARVYDTEKFIGKAIRKAGVPRQDLFLTTKLWCNAFHPDDVEPALDEALADLDTPYIDLFLMHYPCTFKRGTERFPKGEDGQMMMGTTTYVDTWKAMEKLVQKGKAKAIGVSNFSKGEVQKLLDEGSIVPAVHQMELHPYLQQKAFVEWQKSKGIQMIQFSPLANQNNFYRDIYWATGKADIPRLIDEPILNDIGKKYGKSAAQVALAWGLANGRAVIPKSVIDWQMKENLESDFPLDEEDMAKIATLDKALRFNDPSTAYNWKLYSDLEGAWANAK